VIVKLLATTQYYGGPGLARNKMNDAGWVDHPGVPSGVSYVPISASDELAEFAGRLCYQSWDRPNPETATNAGYIANIISQQHFSVLEHASATFYVECSRSMSHEFVRHRHLSFSQVSQRYVDESNAAYYFPPALGAPTSTKDASHGLVETMETARLAYMKIVDYLLHAGYSRKQARQAARAVLPNAVKTKLVVSGNMRAWREVIAKRNTPHADAEIQTFAQLALAELKKVAPSTFQDMEV
jgi:thymidylate synthase (FAD)